MINCYLETHTNWKTIASVTLALETKKEPCNKIENVAKKEGVSLPMNDNIWLQINLDRIHECVILNNNNKPQPYKMLPKEQS